MKFTTEPDRLIIQLEGLERVWALKGRLVIPKTAITAVNFIPQEPALSDFAGYLRIPGTAWPGVFMAGTYHRHHHREFWYVRIKQPGLLTLEISPASGYSYSSIRITCAPEIAQNIATWQRTPSAS